MKKIIYDDFKLFIPDRYCNSNLLNRFKNRSYEKSESDLIKKYFSKDDFVLEVGSCLGYTTAILASKVKKVISFEANPELSECLNLFLKENNIENVVFVFKYISKSKTTVNFQTYDLIVAGSGDRTDNAMGWAKTRKDYQVDCVSIDKIKDVEFVNSLLIDCEGGELSFLKENEDIIVKCKKILIELHGALMRCRRFNSRCIKLIESYGFRKIENMGNCYYFEKDTTK